jgi:hypothetical protein
MEMGGLVQGDGWLSTGRWVAKSGRWAAKPGRWVASLINTKWVTTAKEWPTNSIPTKNIQKII